MKFPYSLCYGAIISYMAICADAAATKSAVFTQGVKQLCDLSRELKGLGKYVLTEVRAGRRIVDAFHETERHIHLEKRSQGRECTALRVLENYIKLKGERMRQDLAKAVEIGFHLAVMGGYASGRIDEFFFEFAGMNTKASANSNDNTCLVVGGSGTTTPGIRPETGHTIQDVKYCFLDPDDQNIANEEGQIKFEVHLETEKAGGAFLTGSAPQTAGCYALESPGSNNLFISQGPATWKVAGGLIEFSGNSQNHGQSKIHQHTSVLAASDGQNPFKKAQTLLQDFKGNLSALKAYAKQLFTERSEEALSEDEEFKRSLYLSGVVDAVPHKINKQQTQLYELVRKNYEVVKQKQASEANAETFEKEYRVAQQQYCKTGNDSVSEDYQGPPPVKQAPLNDSQMKPQIISPTSGAPGDVFKLHWLRYSIFIL